MTVKSPSKSAMQEARETAGLTRSQVAEHLQVAERTIYRWERAPGKRPIPRPILAELARLYGVEIEDVQP